MAAPAVASKPDHATKAVVDAVVAAVKPDIDKLSKAVADVQAKADQVQAPRHVPWATTGPLGQDSRPYSVVGALAVAARPDLYADKFKFEAETARRMKGLYRPYEKSFEGGMLVPYDTKAIAYYSQDGDEADLRAAREVRLRIKAFNWEGVNPWLREKAIGSATNTHNTLSDADGGILRGFPTLSQDMIELQRNQEVFSRLGAQEISLPPNGMMVIPKQTGGTVAYWANEAQAVTASQATFGKLELQAKKLFVITTLTGEMIRFVNPNLEAMLRTDITAQAALAADSAMLYGASNDRVKGLFTYETQAAWAQGSDKVLAYAASGAAADGDLFLPNDADEMMALLPDPVQNQDKRAWALRYDLFAKLRNRRADAVTPGDQSGPYLFDITRSLADPGVMEFRGYPAVRSSQITKAETKGASGATLTSIVHGHWPDWIVARFGVMEFLSTNTGGSNFVNDTVQLRGIQYLDGAPRHNSSFVVCRNLRVA